MLRTYVIPCGTFRKGPLKDDEGVAIGWLIDALPTRVTLILSSKELRALVRAIKQLPSKLTRDRLSERLMQELTNGGPGLRLLDRSGEIHEESESMRALFKAGRVDAVLNRSGRRRGGVATDSENPRRSFVEAAREIEGLPTSRGLRDISHDSQLASLIEPMFRFCGDVVIIDPYLADNVLRTVYGNDWNDEGFRFLVATAAQATLRQELRLRLCVVCCRKRLENCHRKLNRQRDSGESAASALQKPEHALREVTSRLRQRIVDFSGLARDQVDVEVLWAPNFSDRGIIASRRVWNIEHSLQNLSELLAKLRRGKGVSRDKTRIRLYLDDDAREIKQLAEEARSG